MTIDAPTARHDVENILTRYQRAVDEHDLAGLLTILDRARVDFGNGPIAGREALTVAYGAAFSAQPSTRHVLHAMTVTTGPMEVVARAPYQRWTLAPGPARVSALGCYTARFEVAAPGSTAGSEAYSSAIPPVRLAALTIERDWQETHGDSDVPSTASTRLEESP